MSWTFQGSGSAGDAVEVWWFNTGPLEALAPIWRLLLPPGSTSAAYPALPAGVAGLPPASGIIHVSVSDLDAPGAGRDELFHDGWTDQVRTMSSSQTWLP